jgi:hypothetical protein
MQEEEGYGEYEAGGEEDEGGVRKKAITLSEVRVERYQP